MAGTSDALDVLADKVDGEKAIRAIAAELHRRGVTPEQVGTVRRISMWQTVTKNAEAEGELHDLYGFQLAPSWDDGPAWELPKPGPPVVVRPPAKNQNRTVSGTVVVLPDMQCGYFRNAAGDLEPIHDEQAINAALAVVQAAKPSKVVMVGDNADLADFGRYRKTPAFTLTAQATIDYLTVLMGRLRAAAPLAEILWIEGNHEARLANFLIDNAKAAFGLRQGAETPTDWPVLSIPHLCRLADHGVTYVPGYPAAEVWVTPVLRVVHGDKVRTKGSTAHAYLLEARTSIIYGHIHRIEQAYTTRVDHDGPVTVMAASPGCLCRVDGSVPAFGQGVDLDGRPLRRPMDWQQGLAVITTHEDNTFDYEPIHIRDGVARWRGRAFS